MVILPMKFWNVAIAFILSFWVTSCPEGSPAWSGILSADFDSIGAALEAYQESGGSYPTTEQGLAALVEEPQTLPQPRKWIQLLQKVPSDPWKRAYVYRLEKGKFRLWSTGPDPGDPKDDFHYESPMEQKE